MKKNTNDKNKTIEKKVNRAKRNRALNNNEILIDKKNIKIIKNTKPKTVGADDSVRPNRQNRKPIQNQKQKKKKKNKNKKKIIIPTKVKVFLVLGIITIALVCFILSPIFDLKEIVIENNDKVSTSEILELSKLHINDNIFQKLKIQIINNIKENPYIGMVKVKRILPDKISIDIEERKASFQIKVLDEYIYINNQGYILEISDKKLNLPIISGITSNDDNLLLGNRLVEEDLEKLEEVLKIINVANANEIGDLITGINIEKASNYILILESEGKTVHLGDASNIGTRMFYIKIILEKEKGNVGEIFVDGDINKKNPIFSPGG